MLHQSLSSMFSDFHLVAFQLISLWILIMLSVLDMFRLSPSNHFILTILIGGHCLLTFNPSSFFFSNITHRPSPNTTSNFNLLIGSLLHFDLLDLFLSAFASYFSSNFDYSLQVHSISLHFFLCLPTSVTCIFSKSFITCPNNSTRLFFLEFNIYLQLTILLCSTHILIVISPL